MAQNYTRQSSMADGDTITAALFNNEYNQLVNAFAYSSSSASSTGHRHDGSAGQGGNVPQIGDLDFLNKVVVDGTNNRVGFFVEVSSSAVEQVRVQDGAIVPVTDNDIDLGTSSLEFKDLFLDGTAHVDTLDVDVNATIAGTLGVTGVLTGSSLDISGDIDIDGTSNLDVVDIDGAVDMATTLNVAGVATVGGLTIGSAVITEAELETIDTITAGTITASKAVVVDSNKDVSSFRNVTLTGELDAATGDFSGNVDIDGDLLVGDDLTLDSDAAVLGFGADTDVTLTHVADTGLLLNSTMALQFNDASQFINAPSATVLDINATDEIELNATLVDINANVEVSGTLTVAGAVDFGDAALSNVGAVQLDSIAGDADSNTSITFSGSDVITIAAGGDNQVTFTNGAIVPSTDNDIDLGTSSVEFKDAFFDGTVTTDALVADTADINGGTVDGAIIGGNSAAAITGTVITGTSFVIGSADISEAELETIDGVTAGTVAASKAVVVDANKDIGSFRNITLTGELDAGSLDISGNADIDGTLETDALSINGTAVTSTAAEINIVDGNTSATSTTLADADRVVVNDSGTMVQVALTDFETYFESALDTLSNVTTVGALNSGSITSGFGAINNGSSAITTTGTVTYGSLSDGSITVTAFVDEDDMSSNSATLIPTQQSVKAYVDSQVTAQDLDFQADSGGALSIDLDSETLTFTGGTGIATSGSGNAVTFAIDSTVATLTGSQTLTNKTLTAPTLTGTAVVASLDISGDVDVDGTLETDALSINGTTVTSTAAELNILDGVTSTAAELNILDGVTATTAELNYVDGVTSAIQTQIDAKAPIANPTFTGSFTSPGIDDNADAIAITIDSSENVGIGNTGVASTRLAVTGSVVGANIVTTSSDAGHEGLIVNRQNSDGTAIAINKAGSNVGSIGTNGGTLYMSAPSSSGAAIVLNQNANIIYPGQNSSGTVSVTDDAIDLGASAVRFKDLHMSGIGFFDLYGTGVNDGNVAVGEGVYVGAISSANQLRSSSEGGSSTTLYIGNAAIQVSSDQRLKTNIVDTEMDALEKVNQVRIVDFNWDDPSDTSFNNRNARGKWTGVLAQELVDIFPFAVNAPRNESDLSIDTDSEQRWLVDQAQMVPVLIKAIQQLSARVDELEEG